MIAWFDSDSIPVELDTPFDLIPNSGYGPDASELNPPWQSTLDSVDFFGRVMVFDGSTRYSVNLSEIKAVAALIRLDVLNSSRLYNRDTQLNGIFFNSSGMVVDFFASGDEGQYTVPMTAGDWHVILITGDVGFDNYAMVDLMDVSLNNTAGFNPGTVRIGNPASSFQGGLKSLFYFDEVLTLSEGVEFSNALMDLYVPPLDLGNDFVSSSPCTESLWLDADSPYEVIQWSDGSTGDTLHVSSGGVQWVEAVDVFGRVVRDTVRILPPGVYIDSFDLCAGEDSLWETGLRSAYTHSWSTGDLGDSTLIDMPGNYSLEVVDPQGCVYQHQIVVNEDDFPSLVDLGMDTSFCSGNCIPLPSTSLEFDSYQWNDGSVSDCYEVESTGTYWLEAINSNSCVSRDTIAVEIIGEAPVAAFGNSIPCEGDLVQFVNNSQAPSGSSIVQNQWDFGNGDSSLLEDPVYPFGQVDTLQVTLLVITDEGCEDESIQELIIHPVPVPGFMSTPLCHAQEVEFSDASTVSTGSIISADWLIDGQMYSGASISAAFEMPGEYSLRLIAESDDFCRDTLETLLTVNGTPTGFFDTETVCIGEPSVFSAEVDESISGPVNQFSWDFGSGASIFQATAFTFASPGEHQVELVVTSALGCPHDTVISVFVADDPAVGFTSGIACIGLPVQFNDTSVLYAGDAVSERTWFIANVQASTAESPTFTFDIPGIYPVSLAVETTAGCSSQVQGQVEVSENPVAAFSMIPNIGSPPLSPEFENFSEGASTYMWTLDQGQSSMEFIPTHTFTDSGLVNVTLEVFNEAGCGDVTGQPLFLTEPLVDLVLLDVDFTIQGDFLKPILSIRNLGNYDLEDFVIEVEVTQGPLIQETWQGLLQRNQSIIYPMATGIHIAEELPLFCVRLIPPAGRQDQDESNNLICREFGNVSDEVLVITPRPNPVTTSMFFTLVNAGDKELVMELIDLSGKVVTRDDLVNSGELVQEFEVDMSAQDAGQYMMRLLIGLEEKVYNIQVMRN